MKAITPLSLQQIIDDPYGAYVEFHSRLITFGANAPFPEFKPSVETILNAIEGERFSEVLDSHPDLLMEKYEVVTNFTHLNLTFFFDDQSSTHPYRISFNEPFPYRPTLEAIENGLKLLDKLNRLEPGNRAVPFYHFDRYAYHKFGIFSDPDVVIFPISETLDFYDLLRVRSVPIGFIGVSPETIRLDRHWQSPLDFWYHDINHVRRMTDYLKKDFIEQGLDTNEKKYEYYKRMDVFLSEKIIPCITDVKDISEQEFALKKMVQILVFEVVHESALMIQPEVIAKELMRPAGPQPFEHMVGEDSVVDIEKFRTPTGNIASGASVVEADPLKTTSVRYFFDRSLGLLSTVYNKLNFGFYDDPDHPSDMAVPVKYRTVECLADAVLILLGICEISTKPDKDVLMQLIKDRQGSHEKYVYKGVLVNEETNQNIGSYATDPLPVKQIMKEIFGLGKNVCLFMGYSNLGYQDEKSMLGTVREKLSTLSPDEYVVCIGATSDGIGKAYEVAKELGFETIGIVSTLGLSSAGSFSKHVDRIYVVNDDQWGGYIPGTNHPAPTTRLFLETADIVHAIGGGYNTATLLQIAVVQYGDLKVTFTPADMDHKRSEKKGFDPAGPASKISLARSTKKK